MGRPRTGSIFKSNGQIFARITFTDEFGKRRDVKRKAFSRTHARQLIKGFLRGFERRAEDWFDSRGSTFPNLPNNTKKGKPTPAKSMKTERLTAFGSHPELKRS